MGLWVSCRLTALCWDNGGIFQLNEIAVTLFISLLRAQTEGRCVCALTSIPFVSPENTRRGVQ